MKIDRVRSLHVSAEWDYHEPLGEAHLSRPEPASTRNWRMTRPGPSKTVAKRTAITR